MSGPAYANDPRRTSSLPILILLVVIVGLGAFGLARCGPGFGEGDRKSSLRAVTARGDLEPVEKTRIAVFRRSVPSVVSVSSRGLVRSNFGIRRAEPVEGSGTGVVWDDEGHILTNYHVIEIGEGARSRASDEIMVQLATMRDPVRATVVGAAMEYDLALLKVDVEKKLLIPITVGTSRDLEVGQTTLAIGNPFGLDHTLTTGVISQLGRRIRANKDRVIDEVIQTDAAINPGNSGGPLLDSAGRLIGITTAIYSDDENANTNNVGIGFAIPVDTVNWVAASLKDHGKIVRPKIGASLIPTSNYTSWTGPKGLLVRMVVDGGPAQKAGLRGLVFDDDRRVSQIGDVITHIDRRPIERLDDFHAAMEAARNRESVLIRRWYGGTVDEIEVALVEHDFFGIDTFRER